MSYNFFKWVNCFPNVLFLSKSLEHITTATVMSMNPMPEQWDPNGPPPYDFAASLPSLMMDIGRLKALCRTVWQHYKTIDDEVTFNKTWIFLFCAPHRVCRGLSVNIVSTSSPSFLYEQLHEKTCFLHMQKQSCRSAAY